MRYGPKFPGYWTERSEEHGFWSVRQERTAR